MKLLDAIAEHGRSSPRAPALVGRDKTVVYGVLQKHVGDLREQLFALGRRIVGLDLDNGPEWALIDLAALDADICLVPLPSFFSGNQLRHCLAQAGVQLVISDRPDMFAQRAGLEGGHSRGQLLVGEHELSWMDTGLAAADLPSGVAKITYTSGTTGDPKGVMLSKDTLDAVSSSLAECVAPSGVERHLSLMPLPVLLENIAGIYVPLLSGASAMLPSMSEVGIRGAAGVDAKQMHRALLDSRADSAVFTPHSLDALLGLLERGADRPELRFAALGGAVCSPLLHQRAADLGIPVFEGYGASEAASVITLNRPAARRVGSVGQVLPHLQLRVSAHGDIEVKGPLFLGYLGQPAPVSADGWWSTGDVGRIDEDGFVFLQGRRRNVFITALGRNVSPEWVEGELCAEAAIAQAAVFGEARPFNTAIIVPMPGHFADDIEQAIAGANARLPDYARVARWLPAVQPFTPDNGQLSANGRLRREYIEAAYKPAISAEYIQ